MRFARDGSFYVYKSVNGVYWLANNGSKIKQLANNGPTIWWLAIFKDNFTA